MSEKKPLVGK